MEEKTCPHCQKVYSWKKGLDRHLQECGKDPQYKCPFCHHRSKRKENLTKHIMNKHADQMIPYDCAAAPKFPIPRDSLVFLE